MGDVSTHWEDAGRLSPLVDIPTDGVADETAGRQELFLHPLVTLMVEAVLEEVETYVACLHNTVAHFIATRTIMNLCLA